MVAAVVVAVTRTLVLITFTFLCLSFLCFYSSLKQYIPTAASPFSSPPTFTSPLPSTLCSWIHTELNGPLPRTLLGGDCIYAELSLLLQINMLELPGKQNKTKQRKACFFVKQY